MRVSYGMRTAHITAVSTVQQIDLCLFDHRDLSLSSLLFEHDLAALVQSLLVTGRRVLSKYFDFGRCTC